MAPKPSDASGKTDQHIITRFAPSPTGHLHIGGARTALFCWAYAHGKRANGSGRFLLRIEDTDQKRSSEAAARGILEDLAWLGIDWQDGPEFVVHGRDARATDGKIGGDTRGVGPYFQAQRLGIYDAYIQRLIDADLAYPAFDTGEELDAMRAEAREAKRTFRYIRAADYDREASLARVAAGEEHVIRFRMPAEAVVVRDEVAGEVTFPYEELDDFIIRKRDGFPTYHLAVVVDDELMGVTHVLRGQEHLNNTPKHVALQGALTHEDGSAFGVPSYAHMPLIFNADGSKMSKRDKDKVAKKAVRQSGSEAVSGGDLPTEAELEAWLGDKTAQLPSDQLVRVAEALAIDLPEIDVEDFRRAGYLPEVVCNYIALLGWSKGDDVERFTMAEFCEKFELGQIGKSAAKFDREKLLAFNFDTIQVMEPTLLAERWRAWCERYDPEVATALGERMPQAAGAARQRAKTLRQLREPLGFLFVADDAIEFDAKAVKKVLHKNDGEGLRLLPELGEMLAAVDDWSPGSIEAAVGAWCEGRGLGMGKAAQPLRVAMTGTSVSPGLGDTLSLIGKASVLARIERCVATNALAE
ncbi:MAG: glutamate--tRNA ligase [Planctomycetota bacterium]